ncbi:hypothetical protein AB0395_47805 [Streptosporangium sp. NPDC051023]|uniref:hypothetical protein n=1 Tax=Streptosporangium sp. NPDC051023 TaxID=3155410 RepID=UPI00344FF715
MSSPAVPPRPPLVLYGSRMVWLQAWRRGETQWMASIFYAEDDGNRRYVVERWALAEEIIRVPGEDYNHVPRLHTPLSEA